LPCNFCGKMLNSKHAKRHERLHSEAKRKRDGTIIFRPVWADRHSKKDPRVVFNDGKSNEGCLDRAVEECYRAF